MESLRERISDLVYGLSNQPPDVDKIVEACREAITDAEFDALATLGLERFREEEVLCFISKLREVTGLS